LIIGYTVNLKVRMFKIIYCNNLHHATYYNYLYLIMIYYFKLVDGFDGTEAFEHAYLTREYFHNIIFTIPCYLLNPNEMLDVS